MNVKLEDLLLALGGVLLGVGLILGLTPLSDGGVNCGSAFTGVSSDAYGADLTNTMIGGELTDHNGACEDAVSSRRGPALALAIPGAAALVVGYAKRGDASTPSGASDRDDDVA